MSKEETNNGKNGGLLKGKSHDDGGISAVVVTDNDRPVELEGEEVIINKKTVQMPDKFEFEGSMKTPKEILSDLNQAGGGVPIFKNGGEVEDWFGAGGTVHNEDNSITIKYDKMPDGKYMVKFPEGEREISGWKLYRYLKKHDFMKTGGNVEECGDCEDKKNKYFIARTKYATILAKLHPHKLFRIDDLKVGDYIFKWCSKIANYCLYKIDKIAPYEILATDVAMQSQKEIPVQLLMNGDVTLYAEKLILQDGGNLSEQEIAKRKRFSDVQLIDRNEIIVKPELFQGRQVKFSQKTVDKIVHEGFDKSADPIVIWYSKKEKKYIVISGHSRWEASEILFKKGDTSLAQMPVKLFNGSKEDAIEYAVIESNRGADPESLLSDVLAYKLAVKNGWNKERLMGFFAPESRISKLRDLSFLNTNGMFFQYLGKSEETSFPFIERNARWVGIIRKSYPEKFTDQHETEIFEFFWKPKKGKPQYGINKQKFFHLIEKKLATLDFDNTKPLNLENIKVSRTIGDIDKSIEELDSSIEWLFSQLVHNMEIKINAQKQRNNQLAETKVTENQNILKTLEAKVEKKTILANQIEAATKAPVIDLFSQSVQEPVKKQEEGISMKDKDLIKIAEELKKETVKAFDKTENKVDLFIGTVATGHSYADRSVEKNGDYKKICHVGWDGTITVYDKSDKYKKVIEIAESDAKKMKGELGDLEYKGYIIVYKQSSETQGAVEIFKDTQKVSGRFGLNMFPNGVKISEDKIKEYIDNIIKVKHSDQT